MKPFIFFLFALIPLFSDDIQRVQGIVQEIELLQNAYEKCQKELHHERSSLPLIDEQKCDLSLLEEQNKKLLSAIEEKEKVIKDCINQNIMMKEKATKESENQIIMTKEMKSPLQAKEKMICEKRNPFPELMMKEKYKKKSKN